MTSPFMRRRPLSDSPQPVSISRLEGLRSAGRVDFHSDDAATTTTWRARYQVVSRAWWAWPPEVWSGWSFDSTPRGMKTKERRLKFKKQPCSACGRTQPAKTQWGLCMYGTWFHSGCWGEFQDWAETQDGVPNEPDFTQTRVLIDAWLSLRGGA